MSNLIETLLDLAQDAQDKELLNTILVTATSIFLTDHRAEFEAFLQGDLIKGGIERSLALSADEVKKVFPHFNEEQAVKAVEESNTYFWEKVWPRVKLAEEVVAVADKDRDRLREGSWQNYRSHPTNVPEQV